MKKLVVFGLIHNNTFLALRRSPDHVNEPNSLTLPAGHVKDNEETVAAVYRELKEEFDITNIKSRLIQGPYPHENKKGEHFMVYFYLIEGWDGKFKNLENQELFELELNRKNINKIDIESSRVIMNKLISGAN